MRVASAIVSIVVCVILLNACKKDQAEPVLVMDPQCDSLITFSGDVLPIFQNNCSVTGCHDAGGASLGYVFETHTQITGDINIAMKAIRHEAGATPMPYQSPQLPDSSIQKIECWISAGMPNN